MSQPTLSRLENAPSWRELARMGLSMIDLFCESFDRVPDRIVLDIDENMDVRRASSQSDRSGGVTLGNAENTYALRRLPVGRFDCDSAPHPETGLELQAA
jgi:hypothetical protein